jgi:hypothetical protein
MKACKKEESEYDSEDEKEMEKIWQEFVASDDRKSIDEERENEFNLKIYSLKVDLANFEEFGIKEQEFSEIFKSEPIYTVA